MSHSHSLSSHSSGYVYICVCRVGDQYSSLIGMFDFQRIFYNFKYYSNYLITL